MFIYCLLMPCHYCVLFLLLWDAKSSEHRPNICDTVGFVSLFSTFIHSLISNLSMFGLMGTLYIVNNRFFMVNCPSGTFGLKATGGIKEHFKTSRDKRWSKWIAKPVWASQEQKTKNRKWKAAAGMVKNKWNFRLKNRWSEFYPKRGGVGPCCAKSKKCVIPLPTLESK